VERIEKSDQIVDEKLDEVVPVSPIALSVPADIIGHHPVTGGEGAYLRTPHRLAEGEAVNEDHGAAAFRTRDETGERYVSDLHPHDVPCSSANNLCNQPS